MGRSTLIGLETDVAHRVVAFDRRPPGATTSTASLVVWRSPAPGGSGETRRRHATQIPRGQPLRHERPSLRASRTRAIARINDQTLAGGVSALVRDVAAASLSPARA